MVKHRLAMSSVIISILALASCTQPDKPVQDQKVTVSSPTDSTTSVRMESVDKIPLTVHTAANPNWRTYDVLIDASYPPFEIRQPDGTVGGVEVELFNAIAKDQQFNVNYIPHAWQGIFDTLNESGTKGDIIVSAVGDTQEAKAKADITDAYYYTPYRVITMDGSKLENWQSLAKIGVSQSEDAVDDLPRDFGIKPEQIVSHKTVFLALKALSQGEVDAVVADATVMQYYLGNEAFKSMQDKFSSKNLKGKEGSNLVFAVEKGHPDLVAKINKGLANIKQSGEFERIMQRYNLNPKDFDAEMAASTNPANTAK